MSLDITLYEPRFNEDAEEVEAKEVWSRNITHNLSQMAQDAGIYEFTWNASSGIRADDLTGGLLWGIKSLVRNKKQLEQLNPANGWGSYEDLLEYALELLKACLMYPKAKISVSR